MLYKKSDHGAFLLVFVVLERLGIGPVTGFADNIHQKLVTVY